MILSALEKPQEEVSDDDFDEILDELKIAALLAIPEEIEVDVPLDGCVELISGGE